MYLEQLELSVSRLRGEIREKCRTQYSLRGDGKPVFSDCNALGVERNYGCKSHFQDSSSGDPGFCDLPGTKTQRKR